MELSNSSNAKIAVPGLRTNAFLAVSLLLGQCVPRHEVVPCDEIVPKVATGEFEAGLIIHEGQLTYEEAGLICMVNLGIWWSETRNLPLGGNPIRRDLASKVGS